VPYWRERLSKTAQTIIVATLFIQERRWNMDINDVKKICVVGAGTMGSQIAMQCALHKYNVTLHDVSFDLLNKAMESNKGHLKRRVDKGTMTQKQMEESLQRIACTDSLEKAASKVDFVIEAVFEKLEVKKDVISKLDRICPSRCILATNSSYLGNSLIAPSTNRPEKVVNMHFFHPVLVMKLVEVVKGEKTSEETVQIAADLAKRIDRVPVILKKEVPGFLVNSILMAIRRESYDLLENGVASFEDIDKACELGLNFPMGPFKLADFSGLDIGYNAMLHLHEQTKDPRYLPPQSLKERVERGDLGRKTGKGFYDYKK
jgi:3-hydroxybutyryl-CoA dehydrogenase